MGAKHLFDFKGVENTWHGRVASSARDQNGEK